MVESGDVKFFETRLDSELLVNHDEENPNNILRLLSEDNFEK